MREDFFLGRSFRNMEDLNAQLRHWLDTVANARVHATARRVVSDTFAEERSALRPLPLAPYRAVLKLERRLTHEGTVSVAGNFYSIPDTARRRTVDVHVLADEIQIYENGVLIAFHVADASTECEHFAVQGDHGLEGGDGEVLLGAVRARRWRGVFRVEKVEGVRAPPGWVVANVAQP